MTAPLPAGGALDAERADDIHLPLLPECYDLMAYKEDGGASAICGYSARQMKDYAIAAVLFARAQQAGAGQAVAVPVGYKLVAVNSGFEALMGALDYANRKGYLPDALVEEWEAFDYAAAPQPAPASVADKVDADSIDDMIFAYAPSCPIGEGRELVAAILAAKAKP